MRRSQSIRHYTRPSIALGADDLGQLREGDETDEDILRRQLLEKDRENDKLQTQIQILQAQLAERPPIERIQELEKEYRNLDLLLQGTQRENERCMTELERAKTREKMLERELAKLAGENWQSTLEIAPSPVISGTIPRGIRPRRSDTMSSSSSSAEADGGQQQQQRQTPVASVAHIEQVRMLILGMEQRLQTREEKLLKTIERAEGEGRRFEDGRRKLVNVGGA